VGIAVFVVAVWVVTSGAGFDRTQTPATSGPTGPSLEIVHSPADFVLDLETGEKTRLPNTILRRVRRDIPSDPRWLPGWRYAASADGSAIAFVALADDGTYQIFETGMDRVDVRQLTHDPIGALSPAWSPHGSSIVYVGNDDDGSRGLFVLDVATGDVTPVLEGVNAFEPQFTPDGASIVYSGGPNISPGLRIVPVAGGKSTVFLEPGQGLNDAGNGSLSPDGTRVTYLGSGSPLAPDGSPLTFHGEEVTHAGPGRFVSNVDGTGFGLLPGYVSNPAGTWSPDGTRIVCSGDDGVSGGGVIVVDVATGDFTRVAEGKGAIWLDDHTLLVETGVSI
jgi:Tol biopolymer transport system component